MLITLKGNEGFGQSDTVVMENTDNYLLLKHCFQIKQIRKSKFEFMEQFE